MSNWASNPEHQRAEIAKHSLPFLRHAECTKNCIDDIERATNSQAEQTCITNCQHKVQRAFEMFMGMQQRWAVRKNFRDYVDISRYTGMEVEAKHDT